MKKTDWKDTAELVGIAAIVASLVFVGLELRQSQQIAIAGQYQQRTEAFVDVIYRRLDFQSEHKRLAERARAQFSSEIELELLEAMSDEQVALAWTRASANLSLFDNNYFQYESGLMSEDAWQSQLRRLKGALQYEAFYRAEIITRSQRYRDSFLEVAMEIIEELDSADR